MSSFVVLYTGHLAYVWLSICVNDVPYLANHTLLACSCHPPLRDMVSLCVYLFPRVICKSALGVWFGRPVLARLLDKEEPAKAFEGVEHGHRCCVQATKAFCFSA